MGESIKGKREAAKERQVKSFELRKGGASFRAIGRALDVSEAQAHRDVHAVLKRLAAQELASAEEYRTMELERLDLLQAEATRILKSQHPFVSGGKVLTGFTQDGKPIGITDDGPKLQAIEKLIRISESRRKLLGLDAPIEYRELPPIEALPDLSEDELNDLYDKLFAGRRG